MIGMAEDLKILKTGPYSGPKLLEAISLYGNNIATLFYHGRMFIVKNTKEPIEMLMSLIDLIGDRRLKGTTMVHINIGFSNETKEALTIRATMDNLIKIRESYHIPIPSYKSFPTPNSATVSTLP